VKEKYITVDERDGREGALEGKSLARPERKMRRKGTGRGAENR